jgi:Fe-S cluster assembly protein SufD
VTPVSAKQQRAPAPAARDSAAFAAYRADYETQASGPEWLNALREQGISRFESVGFPTMKDEDWHFTSVAPIADKSFHLATRGPHFSREKLESFAAGFSDWPTLVFVNGRYAPGLSKPPVQDGVRVESLAAAIRRPEARIDEQLAQIAGPSVNAFAALNAAFLSDGALIHIAADVVLDKPVHLIFVSAGDGLASHPRNLVIADRNSRCSIIESYVSIDDSRYFTNAVTEIYVEDGARVDHYKLQRESESAFHVGTVQVRQRGASQLHSFSFAIGGQLSRTNIYTVLDGEGASCTLNGLYLADGTQHIDHQTRIEHVQPNCPSREVYKGVLDGRSHGVFNGKVYVHPEAQKTDGKQSNNNLLLSANARVDTKPQLEIFADDVKCTHGATVGRLDEMAMFYLNSRGIGTETARTLLTYAFAADVLEMIELEPLKKELEAMVLARFAGPLAD